MKHQWFLLFITIVLVIFAYSFANADVTYIGEDTETKGDWVGTYGENGVILFAVSDLVDLKDITAFDDGGNNRWDWANPTDDVRGVLYIDGSGNRTGSCIYNNPDGLLTIETILSAYQVTAYMVDWDSTERVQTLTGFQGDAPDEPDVTVDNPVFNAGVYHIWNVNSSTFNIKITHEGGANWVMSGLFVDAIDTTSVKSGGKLTTTWGQLKR